MLEALLLVAIAGLTAGVGVLGGLGGAVLLVPTLVLLGWPATQAAPLGLILVAGGSIAAGSRQLAERSVNHRLGVTIELAATSGAVAGALLSTELPEDALVVVLAGAALAAAFLGGRRRGLRNPPVPGYEAEDVGERVGSLAGAYPITGGVARYDARRLPLGLTLMALAGLVAGTTGTSGGFIKTPITSEIMQVPTKVAAATTTFTIGVTASAALIVFALRGRIDIQHSSAVIFGSLAGGWAGAAVQSSLSPVWLRRGLSVVLVVIAFVLVLST